VIFFGADFGEVSFSRELGGISSRVFADAISDLSTDDSLAIDLRNPVCTMTFYSTLLKNSTFPTDVLWFGSLGKFIFRH
jgi:hypothetical protein